jgi:hypothetical protein
VLFGEVNTHLHLFLEHQFIGHYLDLFVKMKFSVVVALLFSSAAVATTVDLSVIPACAVRTNYFQLSRAVSPMKLESGFIAFSASRDKKAISS